MTRDFLDFVEGDFSRFEKEGTVYRVVWRVKDGFIPPHGGYKDLLSFRKSPIVFDATVLFCEKFVDKRSRAVDQMVQAARSGKQIFFA